MVSLDRIWLQEPLKCSKNRQFKVFYEFFLDFFKIFKEDLIVFEVSLDRIRLEGPLKRSHKIEILRPR